MRKHKNAITLIALALLIVGGMIAATWSKPPEVAPLKWGPSAGDTMSIMERSAGADSIQYDTAWINLKPPKGSDVSFEAIEEIGFLVKYARCWDSTHLTTATDSLTIRLEGEDYFGNLHSIAAVMAYDSTALYDARDSLRDGYWWAIAANDTLLDRFTVQWDSTYTEATDTTGYTAHKMQILGQGIQTRYKRLAVVLKSVHFDSTAFDDTTTIIGQVIYK